MLSQIRNSKRKCGKPIRYHQLKFLKGSGKLGEKNGTDFDQYDRNFNGNLYPSISEFNLLSISDVVFNIIINMNHQFNILPRKSKSLVMEFLFGKFDLPWDDLDFIDAENYVKTINNCDDDSEKEFNFNSDDTDTDEDAYSEYSDGD